MECFKTYGILPEDAIRIRRSVFMEEQGFVEAFDDKDKMAKHIVLYTEKNKAAAVCRWFSGKEKSVCIVGRVAVVKEFRNRKYGSLILGEAERQAKIAGMREIRLAAQKQAVKFYQKQGYQTDGNEFLEEFCPHIWMYKKLE